MTDQQKTDHISDARQMVDYAELGRLAEAADQPMPLKRRAGWWGRRARFEAAFTPAVCRALLSDRAALRSDVADLREHRVTADLLVSSLKADLAEAERERAEAAGLLKPFAEAADDLDETMGDWANIWEAPAAMNIDAGHLRAARTFLQSIARETGK